MILEYLLQSLNLLTSTPCDPHTGHQLTRHSLLSPETTPNPLSIHKEPVAGLIWLSRHFNRPIATKACRKPPWPPLNRCELQVSCSLPHFWKATRPGPWLPQAKIGGR
ncbi:hypothetical protein FOVG_05217 [Fusarium oxysporum f. sp. pisi HDV247]|uniref:Uncharacterized protein n=1 Tax=Fusarium oxysporum f. sp. pisi HDV247 TaxID=1080344 RepID=W9PZT4_FUSOX|nr:hypothetical protein FOVG_05217 [Fusarium oxysporum f. sp. pisi HDV247]